MAKTGNTTEFIHQYPVTDIKDERTTTRCLMVSKSDERELWTAMWKHIIYIIYIT
ncbi:hypothetical protein ACE6H2_020747 [Prunus campanulata]